MTASVRHTASQTPPTVARSNVIRLIPPPAALCDAETIECLETLLERAKKGEVIGIAFAAMIKQRGYIANTSGECYRNPTFTRGMIAALDDHLERLAASRPKF